MLLQTALLALLPWTYAQDILSDPMTRGPELEIVHLFNGQWPTGIAVSATGRKFFCYPAGLDPGNTNNGLNGAIQVAELVDGKEVAYPNVSYNNPPLGSVNRLAIPARTRGLSNYLLGVQSVVIDSADTLWLLDTGRVLDFQNPLNAQLESTPGGPKLVGIDLTTNKIIKTIIFSKDVVFPLSYVNDVRIDRRKNLSGIKGNQGAAYITDSSDEGFNGIITCDLGLGTCWRHLDKAPQVHSIPGTVPFVYGQPMYQFTGLGRPIQPITFGADGAGLSPDGNTFYFSVIGGRFLYSVPTSLLREQGNDAAVQASIKNLNEKGISDGLETDTNGVVYAGNAEQNAISMWNPLTGFATIFVRDPRINWVDTMSIATDGYLYFTVNQLNYLLAIYPGEGLPAIDRRKRPFVAFRAKLPNFGTKITSLK